MVLVVSREERAWLVDKFAPIEPPIMVIIEVAQIAVPKHGVGILNRLELL